MCPQHVTRFDLVRHGETEGGSRYRGSINDALTPQGWVAMRAAVGEQSDWDRIISSPLRRCADFAHNLAQRHALPLVLDARLREIYFGEWEGKTATELLAADPEAVARFWDDPLHFPPPGAEDVRDLQARVLRAWEDMLVQHRGERLLVVTHGGPLRIILGHVQKLSLLESLQQEVAHAERFYIEAQYKTRGFERCEYVLIISNVLSVDPSSETMISNGE